METRVQREKEYHNKRFSNEIREPTTKYYKITSRIREHYFNEIFSNSEANILELGCSKGSLSFKLAKNGANVTGIDISEVAIEIAKRNAVEQNLNGKCNFFVRDASNLNFPEESFDKVIGGAILHHLDYEKALSGISKVLKRDGEAVFIEPLGFNPIINVYRKLTPKFRTVDEKPLKSEELKKLFKYFGKVEITYYYFTTLFAVPFVKFPFFNALVNFFDNIDKLLFKIPVFRKLAWQIIIKVSEPIK